MKLAADARIVHNREKPIREFPWFQGGEPDAGDISVFQDGVEEVSKI
jgi:hypothetical protein